MFSFRQQFNSASSENSSSIELSTPRRRSEVARMMGEDVRCQRTEPQRRFVFLGKAAIYSAGTTFMSFFRPREPLSLARHALMIHERKLSKQLVIDGPSHLPCNRAGDTQRDRMLHCDQNEGFQKLVLGSQRLSGRGAETRPSKLVPGSAGSQEFGADRSGAVRASRNREPRPALSLRAGFEEARHALAISTQGMPT